MDRAPAIESRSKTARVPGEEDADAGERLHAGRVVVEYDERCS
jgi:hypothetical protein